MNSKVFRYLLCLLGVVLALPALVLMLLTTVTPITLSGIVYLLGYGLIAAGLILSPWRPKYPLMLMISGVITIGLMAGIQLNRIPDQTSNIKVIVLPSAHETRWSNRLIDEEDSILFGEALLHLMGGVAGHEHAGIVSALSTTYAQARSTSGAFPSPVVSTYLGVQNPAAFDAVVIEPAVKQTSPVGVVFLHGFMGNVTLQCWQIAWAAEQIGATTVCPSTSAIGDWWQPAGEAIVRETLSYLRGRGIQRFYLGGFSNGGYGLSRLSTALAAEPGLQGFFFIAGASNGMAVREINLPVLVIQGSEDERVPVGSARQFAAALGKLATYVELDADHFLIMKQSEQVRKSLGAWLESQEPDS